MKDRFSSEEWVHEFQEFLSAEPAAPPAVLSERIASTVHSDLNPTAWRVFSKLGLIHVVAGSFSLLVCPQFGFGTSIGLMRYFQHLGMFGCMFACGVVFLGLSALVASLVLRPEEIRALRKKEIFQFAVLGFGSVAVFLCFGATIVFSLTLLWVLGALAGGLASFELGWAVRSQIQHRLVGNL